MEEPRSVMVCLYLTESEFNSMGLENLDGAPYYAFILEGKTLRNERLMADVGRKISMAFTGSDEDKH